MVMNIHINNHLIKFKKKSRKQEKKVRGKHVGLAISGSLFRREFQHRQRSFVISLSKEFYSHCSVLFGVRNRFESDLF